MSDCLRGDYGGHFFFLSLSRTPPPPVFSACDTPGISSQPHTEAGVCMVNFALIFFYSACPLLIDFVEFCQLTHSRFQRREACLCLVDAYIFVGTGLQLHLGKNCKYTTAVRPNISSKLCKPCDTPIAHNTGCVSSYWI